ncbi:MAG: hypothetical protein WBH97_06965 [Rectinemataceae bacterium]
MFSKAVGTVDLLLHTLGFSFLPKESMDDYANLIRERAKTFASA